jgi:hypothetical protein
LFQTGIKCRKTRAEKHGRQEKRVLFSHLKLKIIKSTLYLYNERLQAVNYDPEKGKRKLSL